MLIHNRRTSSIAQLIPANAHGICCGDGVIHDQGFMIAKIAISKPVHQTVGERVKELHSTELGNARSTVASSSKRSYGNVEGTRKRGVCGVRKIDVKFPKNQCV